MSVRKIASWLVLAMVILFLINSPESAAQIVLSGASALAAPVPRSLPSWPRCLTAGLAGAGRSP